jgi:hypothetical protein
MIVSQLACACAIGGLNILNNYEQIIMFQQRDAVFFSLTLQKIEALNQKQTNIFCANDQ